MKIKKLLKKYTTNSIDDNCYYNAEDMIDFAKYVLKEKLILPDVVASLPKKKKNKNKETIFDVRTRIMERNMRKLR